MDREIFGGDVAPGSPTTRSEVKTLCCYLLSQVEEPLSFEQFHEALREYDLVNYFELVGALAQLCETGHATSQIKQSLEYYSITPLGREAAEALAPTIPPAVREKAVAGIRRLLGRQRRLEEVRIRTERQNGGYHVTFSMPAEGMPLASFTVFAPNRQECEKLRRRFLNDPVFIYKSVMALLSGQRDVLGEALPAGEDLF